MTRLTDEQITSLEDELTRVPAYDGEAIPLVVRYTAALIEEVLAQRTAGTRPAPPTDPSFRSLWQYEVENGDTLLGFAEWVEHREERLANDPSTRAD